MRHKMETLIIVLLLGFAGYLLYGLFLSKKGNQLYAQNSGERFELRVGEQVYDVVLNQPFRIATPGGEEIEMVLRRKPISHYEGNGITFDYPAELQLSRDTTNGVTTLTLEGTASPLVLIQIYPASNTPEGVLATLIASFEDAYRSRDAQFLRGNKSVVQRAIGGERHQGRMLKYQIGGEQYVTELYALRKNRSVVAVILQNMVEEKELAENYFAVILESLD